VGLRCDRLAQRAFTWQFGDDSPSRPLLTMRRIPVLLLVLTVSSLSRLVGWQALDNGDDLTGDPRFQQALGLFEVWLDARMAYEQIPAVSVSLVHDQNMIWTAGYGYADREDRIPATSGTLYSICSISKLFTSIGVMQLRDRGKLELNDPLGDHLPWFDLEQAYPDGPDVTVEGILTHSSGLPRESAHPYWTGPDYPFPTREQIIEGLGHQATLYPASRYFQYSNLGMTLAGQLIERISGMTYEEYIQTNVLDPLGLEHTYPEIPDQHQGGLLATGYNRLDREGKRDVAPLFHARGIAPAAGFASSAEDLARFAMWQMRLLEDGGTEVLSANTLREMQRVHWVDPDFETMWGLGFSVRRHDATAVVGHGGSCPGFRSILQYIPSSKLAGAVMINAQGTNPADIFNRMHETIGAAVTSIVADPEGGTPLVSDFEKYEGLYASDWGEMGIIRWKEGLAVVALPSNDPVEAMRELRHVDGNIFRRVRDDGELAEAYIFEVGSDGDVERVSVHGNFSEKVR